MLKKWFRDSETLLWARLQTFIGFLASAATLVDPTVLAPVVGDAAWFPYLLLINGVGTEILRRMRTDDM